MQSVMGTLLYYTRAIDRTMLPSLNDIVTVNAPPRLKYNKKHEESYIMRPHTLTLTLHVMQVTWY